MLIFACNWLLHISHWALYSNSWCDPFKTWQKVSFCLLLLSTQSVLTKMRFSRTLSTHWRTSRKIKLTSFLEVNHTSNTSELHNLLSIPRSTTSLDWAVWSVKLGPHSLASSRKLCRGFLDWLYPSRRFRSERRRSPSQASRFQVQASATRSQSYRLTASMVCFASRAM